MEEEMVFRKDFPAKAQRRKGRSKGKLKIILCASFFAPLRLCGSLLFCLCVLTSACKREERVFSQPPSNFKSYDVTMSAIHPGTAGVQQPVKNPSDDRAFDANEGKRLFSQYNCSGCHFNGGGGIGPPLMDDKWIYGENTENIYSTIVEGRPNGMPSFRQKIPDSQVLQIAAYVRAMSGQLRKDVEPSRNDTMNARRSEQRTKEMTPKQTTAPPQ